MATEASSSTLVLLPDLIAVPAGWFQMGSETGRADERPVHRVLVRACAAGRTPVTNREYACFVAAGQPPPKFWDDPRYNDPAQPAVGVPWADAVAYCAFLTKCTGQHFRLPTEAEWERAACAGVDGRLYPWGDDVPSAAGGISIADRPMDRPAVAGTGPANALGILDMGWNVHEWCSDWYDPAYYLSSPEQDPRGPVTGARRTSRGGAWRHQIKICRSAARSAIPPAFEYADYGFRVFAEVE